MSLDGCTRLISYPTAGPILESPGRPLIIRPVSTPVPFRCSRSCHEAHLCHRPCGTNGITMRFPDDFAIREFGKNICRGYRAQMRARFTRQNQRFGPAHFTLTCARTKRAIFMTRLPPGNSRTISLFGNRIAFSVVVKCRFRQCSGQAVYRLFVG
jgi:hypothetical protein